MTNMETHASKRGESAEYEVHVEEKITRMAIRRHWSHKVKIILKECKTFVVTIRPTAVANFRTEWWSRYEHCQVVRSLRKEAAFLSCCVWSLNLPWPHWGEETRERSSGALWEFSSIITRTVAPAKVKGQRQNIPLKGEKVSHVHVPWKIPNWDQNWEANQNVSDAFQRDSCH